MPEYKKLKDWNPQPGDKFKVVFKEGLGNSVLTVYENNKANFDWFDDPRPIENFGADYILISRGNKMKYEDKWYLNDGGPIPENADTLEKDGSVVAYRLPIREIQVGDRVRIKDSARREVHTVLDLFSYGDEDYAVILLHYLTSGENSCVKRVSKLLLLS